MEKLLEMKNESPQCYYHVAIDLYVTSYNCRESVEPKTTLLVLPSGE